MPDFPELDIELIPGMFPVFTYRKHLYCELTCMVRDGILITGSGMMVPKNEIKVFSVTPKWFSGGYLISPKVVDLIDQYRLKKIVPVPSGETMLVIFDDEEKIDDDCPTCYFIPVFFDSRRGMYMTKDGEDIDVSENIVVDTGYAINNFKLTDEGSEKLKQLYPADI